MSSFDEIDNPESNSLRSEILKRKSVSSYYYRLARQEQEVVDKRALIEELAEMVKSYRALCEKINDFVCQHDIPGADRWCDGYGIDPNTDPIEEAIRWAASNHSC